MAHDQGSLMSNSSVVRALAMAGDPDPRRILQIAVDGAVDVLGVDVAYVKIAEGARRGPPHFRVAESRGGLTAQFKRLVVAPGQGLAGLVARAGRPMAVRDYQSTAWISDDFVETFREEGLRAIACAPIPGSDGILGLLSAGFRSRSTFGDRGISTLEDIANCAGVAMQQALASARRAELERMNERQRLATELHDSVAQSLFAIGVEVNHSRDQRNEKVVQAALERIQSLAASASSELRSRLRLISEVPEMFAVESVVEAEARQCEQSTGATVKIIRRGELPRLPEPHEELICNTVREGLRNAAKHAQAQFILIHLCYSESEIRVAIQTESAGSEPPGWSKRSRLPKVSTEDLPGCGLHLLSKASRRLGGTLDLELSDVGESILALRLPLNQYS